MLCISVLFYFFTCAVENVEMKKLCELTLYARDLERLREAIEDLYYFEFVIGQCCSV